MIVVRTAIAAALLTSALTACSPGGQGDGAASESPSARDPDTTAPSTSQPLPSEDAGLTTDSAVDVAQLVGDLIRLPASMSGQRVGVTALGPGGEVLMSLDSTASLTLAQDRLVLASSAAKAADSLMVPLGPERSKPQQVTGGAVTRDHVVWMESPSTSLDEDPWVMYAYDRRSGATQEVTRAPSLENSTAPPPVPGFTSVVADGENIAWAQVRGRSRRKVRVDVMSCRIRRCVPRVAIRDSAFPQLTAKGIYAVRGGADARTDRRAVVFKSFSGAVVVVQAMPTSEVVITGFAANADSWLVTQRRDGAEASETSALIGDDDGVLEVSGAPQENFGYPVAGTGFVAWAQGSGSGKQLGAYVYSLVEDRLLAAGNRKGLYGVRSSGSFLAWQVDVTRGAADLAGNRWVVAHVPK